MGLRDHMLIVGDARDPSIYRSLLGQRFVDMVITDPPYNVPIDGHVGGKGTVKHDEFKMASGEMSKQEFRKFLSTVLSLAPDAARDGSLHYGLR